MSDKPPSEKPDRLSGDKPPSERPDQLSGEQPSLVHVEIFGQTYAVKAGSDPGYVEKLAASVDEQMKDVSRASGAVDSVRIAVLAALNLADECVRLRRALEEARSQHKSPRGTSDERVKRLAQTLGSALDE